MNPMQRHFPVLLLFAALAAPLAAQAEEAKPEPQPAAGPAAVQPDRMQLMQALRARMHQMMRTQDPEERRHLMEEQLHDMDRMMEMGPPGMGMMMGPGGGPGPMAMGPGGKPKCDTPGPGPGMGMMGMGGGKACKQGPGGHCMHRDGALDQRLDALEKRMDLMQTLLEYLTRR